MLNLFYFFLQILPHNNNNKNIQISILNLANKNRDKLYV